MTVKVKQIKKRTGDVVKFDANKITEAIFKAAQAVGGSDKNIAEELSIQVIKLLNKDFGEKLIPGVEDIQDRVEKVLIETGHAKTAKAYILYRSQRDLLRKHEIATVPAPVKEKFDKEKEYFHNQLAEFVFYRTYARWIPEKNRRETWSETVNRFVSFMMESMEGKLTTKEVEEIRSYILNQSAMPSMRLLQFAGDATRKTNVCAYNCSYIAPKSFSDFGQILYVLACGTGLGYSVEYQYVDSLPQIKKQTGKKEKTYIIPDSKEGWAESVILGMETWAKGNDIDFDYSRIRPAGARLKTMGGRASGPAALIELHNFIKDRMLLRQGRRLTTVDVNDIICEIGYAIVSGGVRRSALISLSDLDDKEMRDAKSGAFYVNHNERSMANNSAVYNQKPTMEEFLDEWVALMKSGSGERGIFNRGSLPSQIPERRIKLLGERKEHLGVNPCGEIILQSHQFCNLSEVVARADDTEETLIAKARVAAILGTYQATLTKFQYISKEWKENCESERLLGVSINGQWDCKAVRNPETLKKMKDEVLRVNKVYSKKFGITPATAATCVKPSGNTSQTFDCASGLHPRYAKYYLRRVRISATDPLFHMLKDQKVPYYPEVGQEAATASTFVVEFPVAAPKGAVTRNDLTALQLLDHWMMLKETFTEHNPSATIYVDETEWLEVGNYVYKNWEKIGGLSFLPKTNHVYQLAPYEEITKEKFDEVSKTFPEIDFSSMIVYELEDNTDHKAEAACVGGACEL